MMYGDRSVFVEVKVEILRLRDPTGQMRREEKIGSFLGSQTQPRGLPEGWLAYAAIPPLRPNKKRSASGRMTQRGRRKATITGESG